LNLDSIITILEFILALGFILLLHELGHFIVGRLFKVEIEEFGIGYPPRLLKLFSWRGTLFSLNWIPFGGFCRFKGEGDPAIQGGLAAANKWVRLSTLSAGPITNLLLATLLFAFVISQFGIPQTNIVEVREVGINSPAEKAGLIPGDIIQQFNNESINSIDELINLTQKNLGNEITLLIHRNSSELTIKLTPRTNPPDGEGPMGVLLGNPMQSVSIFQSIPFGFQTTIDMGKQLFILPILLLRGEVDPSQMRLLSPKGIYDIYSQVRDAELKAENYTPQMGLVNFISFFAVISAALGFSNLLPIPALDGGRLIFLIPEILFNRRVPSKYENMIHFIGFSALLLIMIYVFIQDFINPIVLP